MRLPVLALLTLSSLPILPGCTQFPELDTAAAQVAQDAPYPQLVPLETLLTSAAPRTTPEVRASVEGRVAGLRRRADALRGPVISPAVRARMTRGVLAR